MYLYRRVGVEIFLVVPHYNGVFRNRIYRQWFDIARSNTDMLLQKLRGDDFVHIISKLINRSSMDSKMEERKRQGQTIASFQFFPIARKGAVVSSLRHQALRTRELLCDDQNKRDVIRKGKEAELYFVAQSNLNKQNLLQLQFIINFARTRY